MFVVRSMSVRTVRHEAAAAWTASTTKITTASLDNAAQTEEMALVLNNNAGYSNSTMSIFRRFPVLYAVF